MAGWGWGSGANEGSRLISNQGWADTPEEPRNRLSGAGLLQLLERPLLLEATDEAVLFCFVPDLGESRKGAVS